MPDQSSKWWVFVEGRVQPIAWSEIEARVRSGQLDPDVQVKGTDTDWTPIGLVPELVALAPPDLPRVPAPEKPQPSAEERAHRAAADRVVVSTGSPYPTVEVLDAVIGHGAAPRARAGALEQAFDRAKAMLRERCAELEGDAVVDCAFHHRATARNRSHVEVIAYGTAVRIRGS